MDGETVVAIVFGAALAVFSLVMVGHSFLRGREDANSTLEPTTVEPQSTVKQAQGEGPSVDSIYESIYTLELEYQLGNLPEQQFQKQFQAYRLQAAAALKEQLENGQTDLLSSLEQEVLGARTTLQDNQALDPVCPDCSGPVSSETRDCPHCGAGILPQPPNHTVEARWDEGR